jgi:hypothetical protein
MRESVGVDELDVVATVDAHDAGEPCLGSDPIDRVVQPAQTAANGSAVSRASG